MKDLVVQAFLHAPRQHVIFIAALGIGGVLCLVAMIALFASGDSVLGVYALIATLVLLALSLVLVVTSPRSVVAEDRAQTVRVTWSRRLPRMPIADDSIESLKREVEGLRNQSFAWLSQYSSAIRLEDVRTNLFVPDCGQASLAQVCVLKIHPDLQCGMDGHSDTGMTFKPGQGLTGNVFCTSGEPKIAKTFANQDGQHEFEEWHALTEAQKRVVHPELRWIISFPLKTPHDGGARRCSAVFNVDGLRHELGKDVLQQLCAFLVPSVVELSDKIASLPALTVRITQQES